MKDSLVNVLEDFEKLAYKILMWVILVPKTIIKIVLDPGFVPDYVRGELKSEKGKQFDEYISPMLLYLGVVLVPAVAIYLLPAFDMKIVTPQDDPNLRYDAYIQQGEGYVSIFDSAPQTLIPVTGEDDLAANNSTDIIWHELELKSEATIRGDTRNHNYVFRWSIWRCGTFSPETGECAYDVFWYGEDHDGKQGLSIYQPDENGDPVISGTYPDLYSISIVDRNTISDTFYQGYTPDDSYLVTVDVFVINKGEPLVVSEVYGERLEFAPSYSSPEIYYYESNTTKQFRQATEQENDLFGVRRKDMAEENQVNLAERLESSETIFLGLFLLLPPLLLAGAIGIFAKPKPTLGEEALKENFYAQCYYFVPVGLAFWGFYYSVNFHTYDISSSPEWLVIPLFLAVLWFIGVEIYAIADELPTKRKRSAFFILLGCLFLIYLTAKLGISFSSNYDWIRKSAIWSYPAAGLLLTIGIVVARYRKWREGKKPQILATEMSSDDV